MVLALLRPMKDDSGEIPEADGLAPRVSRIQALRV